MIDDIEAVRTRSVVASTPFPEYHRLSSAVVEGQLLWDRVQCPLNKTCGYPNSIGTRYTCATSSQQVDCCLIVKLNTRPSQDRETGAVELLAVLTREAL